MTSRADEALENLVGMLKAAGVDKGALLNALARASGKLISEVAVQGFEENLVRDFGRRVRSWLKK